LRLPRRHVVQGGEVLLRHEQHVHRRLRRDVVEGDDVFVLEHDLRGHFAPHDPVEDGGHRISGSRQAISLREPNACESVPRSTYSSSPPSGTPCASRLGLTWCWRASCARSCAVASPSTVGLVAMISSRTSPSRRRVSSRSRPISRGPMPSSGDSRPCSTKYSPR